VWRFNFRRLASMLTISPGNTNHEEIFAFDPDTDVRYLYRMVVKMIMKWSRFSIEFDWFCPDFVPWRTRSW
jgi:hypothetical protein